MGYYSDIGIRIEFGSPKAAKKWLETQQAVSALAKLGKDKTREAENRTFILEAFKINMDDPRLVELDVQGKWYESEKTTMTSKPKWAANPASSWA